MRPSALLWLLYPVAVLLGLKWLAPWQLALGLLALVALRWKSASGAERLWLPMAVLALGASAIGNSALGIKLYPVWVNLGLLASFGWSLYQGPSAIERLARLKEPELPPEGVAYTRKVTWIWCGFFVANGGVALWTALYASQGTWALYNGAISYGLIGLLLGGEWCYRQWMIRSSA
ncbi:hypothetical protein PVT67_09835 [Gallaecimonas kandeliae]|uniref:COG4648 family protein n=1 Tax=Gallaecimonas kandeliae TaxID=3029055 RepID=UPI0026470608|nr:hypothetical protein [Gallaecimonas kandeliae]WKE63999.1 hypothetical protein PVT67_09835 [Gallaecimonas kandeliae]